MNDDHLPADQQQRDAEDPGCAADVVPCGSRRDVVVPSARGVGRREANRVQACRQTAPVRSAAITPSTHNPGMVVDTGQRLGARAISEGEPADDIHLPPLVWLRRCGCYRRL
jgi:hypothetical protein